MVSIPACHAGDRSSILRLGDFLIFSQNPSNNSIHLAQYKKEMIINFDPQVMQTSLTNWLSNYVNNNNVQLSNFQAQIFANVGTQIDDLSKKISDAFLNVQNQMNNYVSKVDYLYNEYIKDKENNKDFVDKVINNNNQINETFNSISNNNNNNNMKLEKIDQEINILKESVKKIDNESKNKINIMKNNSDNDLDFIKKVFNKEIIDIKNSLNSEMEKNKSFFKDIQVSINELCEQNIKLKVNEKYNEQLMELANKINQIELKNNINVEEMFSNRLNILNKKIEELKNESNLNNNINNDNRVNVLCDKVNLLENKINNLNERNIIVKEGKIVKEYKDIVINDFEKNSNEEIKKFKLVQNNNKLFLKEITKNCNDEKKEKEVVDKAKIIFKKSINNDIIIYEISTLCKDWEFSRYMKNIFKRVTRSNIRYKVNLKKLEKVYLMTWSEKQIQFTPKNATSNFIYSKNYFVIQGNNFVYVKNNRRRNYRRKFYFKKNKKYNKNNGRYRNRLNKNNENNIVRTFIHKLIGISFNNRRNNNKGYRFKRFNNQSKRSNYFNKGNRKRNNKGNFRRNQNNYNNRRFRNNKNF